MVVIEVHLFILFWLVKCSRKVCHLLRTSAHLRKIISLTVVIDCEQTTQFNLGQQLGIRGVSFDTEHSLTLN